MKPVGQAAMHHIVTYLVIAVIVVAVIAFLLRRGNKAGFDAAVSGAASNAAKDFSAAEQAVKAKFEPKK